MSLKISKLTPTRPNKSTNSKSTSSSQRSSELINKIQIFVSKKELPFFPDSSSPKFSTQITQNPSYDSLTTLEAISEKQNIKTPPTYGNLFKSGSMGLITPDREPSPTPSLPPTKKPLLTEEIILIELEFCNLEYEIQTPDRNLIHTYEKAYLIQRLLEKIKQLASSEKNPQQLFRYAKKIEKLEIYANTHNYMNIANKRITSELYSPSDIQENPILELEESYDQELESTILRAESFLKIANLAFSIEEMTSLLKQEKNILKEQIEIFKSKLDDDLLQSHNISTADVRDAIQKPENSASMELSIKTLLKELISQRSEKPTLNKTFRSTVKVAGVLDEIRETEEQLKLMHNTMQKLLVNIPEKQRNALALSLDFCNPILQIASFIQLPQETDCQEEIPYPLVGCAFYQFAEKEFTAFERSLAAHLDLKEDPSLLISP